MNNTHPDLVRIVHVYHQGWKCVCEAEQVGPERYQAVIQCRSLLSDHFTAQERDSQIHESAGQAIDHAATMAIKWALRNRDHFRPTSQEKPLS